MTKMENKFLQKNFFGSTFDSFEFDDGFLSKVDAESKKDPAKGKELTDSPVNQPSYKVVYSEKSKRNKTPNVKKGEYFDLHLTLDDFNESDFFDFTSSRNGKFTSKGTLKDEKEKKGLMMDNQATWLSPVRGPIISNKNHSFSSTPLKPDTEIPNGDIKIQSRGSEGSQKGGEITPKASDYLYLEADLFEDWGEDINEGPSQKDKSSITLSQAFKMIEEAESQQRETLNQSVDMLTGEVVCSDDVEKLFEESFDKLKSAEKGKEKAEDDCVIVCEKLNGRSRPQAAQKLQFGQEKIEGKDSDKILFSSDDDFDLFTRALFSDPKKMRGTPQKGCDSWEVSDVSIDLGKKRGKCFKIIESDTAEDSPSPKFSRQKRKKKLRKDSREQSLKSHLVDLEAEVSDEVEVSSDEVEEDGEYERSFVDEDSYHTENCSADMTAKYLESVKSMNRAGNFKIPSLKPYNPANVFSQIPEENNTDYEIDSFCVNDVEEEAKTDLSDLEIAEEILEMDRKERRKKNRKFL